MKLNDGIGAGGEVLDGLIRRRKAEALLFEGKAWENV